MNDSTKTNDNIIDRIGHAFPDDTIDATGAFDDWGRMYPDAAEYLENIAGKTWRDADATWLVRRSDGLGFLGTRWLVAVMPIYLISAVTDGVWSPATEMLVLIFARPAVGSDSGLGHERFELLVEALTDEQRMAIGDVLHHVAQVDPAGSLGLAARSALERCWNQYRNERIS